MANPREESVYMAKAAEQAERYEEMVEFMEQVTAAAAAEGDELTSEETLLLSAAYKNVISARRESWRVVSSVAQKEESRGNENRVAPVRGYRAKIESELSSICDGILRLLEAHLIPSTSDPELKIFFLKMKGDYHRYLAEFKMGTDREEAAESTLAAYTSAQDTAVAELSPAHPIRMSLALNLSVFYYQIQNSPAQAYKVAEQAFDDAIEDIDNLPEEHYEDCTSIMKIIRDNLTLWTSDLKENGTRGQSSNP